MPYRDPHTQRTPSPLAPGVTSLGWATSRCLEAPPHPLGCSRCVDACPAAALAFHADGDGVALLAGDTCHGCGQCVAACPSEALVSVEIDALLKNVAPDRTLRLGCHRTHQAGDPNPLHCLRALGPDMLAWLAVQVAPEALVLSLPGRCHGCDAAPDEQPDAWLAQADALCRIEEARPRQEYHAARPTVSRRDLLSGRAAPRLPTLPAGDAAPGARRLQRQRAAAQALGEPRLAPTLPGLSLDADACHSHGVCARVCPTRALEESADGELVFDPLSCLACGHCLSSCPEGALHLTEASDASAVTLRQTRRLDCFLCGRPFTPPGDASIKEEVENTTCPACRCESALMQESFDELFG